MNKENQAEVNVLLMQIKGGLRTVKKIEKEREILENALFDLCKQQVIIKGLELKFIKLDNPTFDEKELAVKDTEIPIYVINQMLNYDELFEKFGQEANSRIYYKLKNMELIKQKRLVNLRRKVKEYEEKSGEKYNLNF